MTKEQTLPPDSQLLKALKVIVGSQLLVEDLEGLKEVTMYNKQKVKQLTNQLIKELCKVAEKDYNAVFGIDEQLTLNIAYEYDKLITMVAQKNVPEIVELSQICEAYNLDRPTLEATTHRIIRKHSNK